VETLPVDADEDSIEASVENGVLTILIGKKEVVEAEPEKEADDTVVKINRKNRK
jgi:HSP20 family molecular chaperone IbpA